MRSLPHVTVACGAIWAGSRLLGASKRASALGNGTGPADSVSNDITSALRQADYRLVAVGSLLPDLVDRAQVAWFGVRRSGPDQHFLGHTLLLNLSMLLTGIYIWRRGGDPKLLSLSAAAMTHLLVDPVVRSPGTLLWPLLGVDFPAVRGLSSRITAVTQIVAATTATMTVFALWRQNRLGELITHGRL